jgi:peptide/nickel transport system substrate-binding protein
VQEDLVGTQGARRVTSHPLTTLPAIRAGGRSRRARFGAAALVAVALLAAGCASDGSSGTDASASPSSISHANQNLVESDERPVMGGQISYGIIAETNGWNPSTNQWATPGLQVTRAIFDTLAAFDDQSQIQPFLAQGFDHNEDFTQWKIRLRPDVKLHNGKPVTAETVVRNQRYLKKSPVVGSAYYVVKGFTAEGEDTVVVDLLEPFVNYPMSLATQLGVVGDPDWMESNDSLHPIGTGPFSFDTWEIGNKLRVKKNPNYWLKDKFNIPYPYLDAIEFRVMADSSSRGSALRAGDVDVIESLSGAQVQSFQNDPEFQVFSHSTGESSESFIQLNTTSSPLDDLDARRALAYATDKQEIVEQMSEGFDEVADGPFAKSSPWYVETDYPQFDQATARQLVEKVKANHNGEFTIMLSGGPDPNGIRLQQLIQAQWQAVGVTVNLETVEQATLIIKVVTGNYQATSWLQFGQPNPSLDAVFWRPDLAVAPPAFSLNFTRLKDEEIGVAIRAGRQARDPEAFKAAYAIVQKRLGADVPYVWLSHQQTSIIASKRVVNVTKYTLPDGETGLDLSNSAHPLYQVWVRDTP